MTTYTFQEVGLTARRKFVCAVCGKRGQRSKRFWQTLNPWNKDSDGNPKSAQQIRAELTVEAEAWQPTRHVTCEVKR